MADTQKSQQTETGEHQRPRGGLGDRLGEFALVAHAVITIVVNDRPYHIVGGIHAVVTENIIGGGIISAKIGCRVVRLVRQVCIP